MRVNVCIGSSCHLKGARDVVEGLQKLIAEHNLGEKIELKGQFCMGNCTNGVCLSIDDKPTTCKPTEVEAFFAREILPFVN